MGCIGRHIISCCKIVLTHLAIAALVAGLKGFYIAYIINNS